MCKIAKYYKCEHCEEFNPIVERAKRYCSRKCRDAAYYQRKLLKQRSAHKSLANPEQK